MVRYNSIEETVGQRLLEIIDHSHKGTDYQEWRFEHGYLYVYEVEYPSEVRDEMV